MRKNTLYLLALFTGLVFLAPFVLQASAAPTATSGTIIEPSNNTIVIGTTSSLDFNVSMVENVTAGTTYNVIFVNTQSGVTHDLTILTPGTGVTSTNATIAPGSPYIALQLTLNTDGQKSGSWTAPSSATWVGFLCTQPGHYGSAGNGMNGVIKVGSPSGSPPSGFVAPGSSSSGGSTPGFEFIAVMFGIMGIAAVHVYHKRH